ncbi:MAG TPA: response regulator [Anaerolineae bacterium]|nr:response regulator [Anaerolineae bacterium]HQK13894.1 response regulator [Anaerolineae bacterium]
MIEQKTILYIEDNPHNRRLVRRTLERRGYTVVEAEDGESGLQMVQELKPPLVLLDIGLPKMDGIEVVGRIKADPALQDIPVIAITASAMQGDRERFLAAGCDDYLSKPIQIFELIEKVDLYYPSATNIYRQQKAELREAKT